MAPKKKRSFKADVMQQTLMDDGFMRVVLRNLEASQYLLRILLEMPDLVLIENHTHYFVDQKENKSAALDVWAKDSSGRGFHIEVQNRNDGDHLRRVRYYSAVVDTTLLRAGDDYTALPDAYLVFITRSDFLRAGVASCEVKKTINGREYDDGRHIIHVNATVDDGSEIAKLMAYFKTSDPKDMSFGALSERVRHIKLTEGGLSEMCEFTQKYYDEGRKNTLVQMVTRAVKKGVAPEQAMENLSLNDEEKAIVRKALAEK